MTPTRLGCCLETILMVVGKMKLQSCECRWTVQQPNAIVPSTQVLQERGGCSRHVVPGCSLHRKCDAPETVLPGWTFLWRCHDYTPGASLLGCTPRRIDVTVCPALLILVCVYLVYICRSDEGATVGLMHSVGPRYRVVFDSGFDAPPWTPRPGIDHCM